MFVKRLDSHSLSIYQRSDIGGRWMDSTQLDVRSLGTRGEIAELIGSPSWDATRTLWMPGLVSAIHSNYCNTPALQVYHTHGLVPINVCTLQNIEMVCGPEMVGTPHCVYQMPNCRKCMVVWNSADGKL